MTKNIKIITKQLFVIFILLLVSSNTYSQNYNSRQKHWYLDSYIPEFKLSKCKLIDGKLKFEISYNGGDIIFYKEGSDAEKFLQIINNNNLTELDKNTYVCSIVFEILQTPPEGSFYEYKDSIYPLYKPNIERRYFLDQAIRRLLKLPDDGQPVYKFNLYQSYSAMVIRRNSESKEHTVAKEEKYSHKHNETEYDDIAYDNYENNEIDEEDALDSNNPTENASYEEYQNTTPEENRLVNTTEEIPVNNIQQETENIPEKEKENNLLENILIIAFLYFLFAGGKKAKKELDADKEKKDRKRRLREEEEKRREEQEKYDREHYFFLQEKENN